MPHGKNVLTTGDVAKLCSVAPRTVSKWFDSGQLRGYRIPGSKDRRIPVGQLIRFMRAHGMPLDGLESGQTRIVVLDGDAGLRGALERALLRDGGYEVRTASCAFEAGAAAQALKPHVIVLDVTLADVTPGVISRFVRSSPDLPGVRLIGTAPGLTEAEGHALLQDGFHGYLSKPFETRSLIRLIEADAGVSARSRV
ncbi:MAG: response regulator [Phycisphaerae bacterium]